MASNPETGRSGQAMTEFVVAILAIVLVISATVEFLPVLLKNIGLLKDVREEAGTKAISADSGILSADRSSEFEFKIPGLLEVNVQISSLESSNADVMLYSVFEDAESLKGYSTHPEHVFVADTYVRPFTQTRLCLDFEV